LQKRVADKNDAPNDRHQIGDIHALGSGLEEQHQRKANAEDKLCPRPYRAGAASGDFEVDLPAYPPPEQENRQQSFMNLKPRSMFKVSDEDRRLVEVNFQGKGAAGA
jgi:hypothetical protein